MLHSKEQELLVWLSKTSLKDLKLWIERGSCPEELERMISDDQNASIGDLIIEGFARDQDSSYFDLILDGILDGKDGFGNIADLVDQLEQKIIERSLARNRYHRKKTASELGITRVTLYNKMKKFGLLD